MSLHSISLCNCYLLSGTDIGCAAAIFSLSLLDDLCAFMLDLYTTPQVVSCLCTAMRCLKQTLTLSFDLSSTTLVLDILLSARNAMSGSELGPASVRVWPCFNRRWMAGLWSEEVANTLTFPPC